MNKFPGRGGGKRCAESFGVSPQQWSPWESGKRTPDELRLEQIANFFASTVEWFRRDHRQEMTTALTPAVVGEERPAAMHTQVLGADLARARAGMLTEGEEEDITHYLWVIDLLTRKLTANGIRVVVSFERQTALTTAS